MAEEIYNSRTSHTLFRNQFPGRDSSTPKENGKNAPLRLRHPSGEEA